MNQSMYEKLLPEWQNIVDLIAHIAKVPVGLIMGLHDENLTVMAASQTGDNPYHVGEKTPLRDSGLYCERVITSRQMLLVPDALRSPEWDHNPDLKHHMVAYLGFPIRLPDGRPFGTICLLDRKKNDFSQDVITLIEKMRILIEGSLTLHDLLHQNAKRVAEIHEKNHHLEKLIHALNESEKNFVSSLKIRWISSGCSMSTNSILSTQAMPLSALPGMTVQPCSPCPCRIL